MMLFLCLFPADHQRDETHRAIGMPAHNPLKASRSIDLTVKKADTLSKNLTFGRMVL